MNWLGRKSHVMYLATHFGHEDDSGKGLKGRHRKLYTERIPKPKSTDRTC